MLPVKVILAMTGRQKGGHPMDKKSRTPKRKYGPNSDFRNKTKGHLAAQELFIKS
jgi:hypothetical protein